jgi:hypothetical protein
MRQRAPTFGGGRARHRDGSVVGASSAVSPCTSPTRTSSFGSWTCWEGSVVRPRPARELRGAPGARARLSNCRCCSGARRAEPQVPHAGGRVEPHCAACGLAWVGVSFDAEDARATTRPPARPMASAIAERAAGLIVQLMPAQLSIPSQESTERDPGPSAVIAKPTVRSTSGNSKPPSAAQIPADAPGCRRLVSWLEARARERAETRRRSHLRPLRS